MAKAKVTKAAIKKCLSMRMDALQGCFKVTLDGREIGSIRQVRIVKNYSLPGSKSRIYTGTISGFSDRPMTINAEGLTPSDVLNKFVTALTTHFAGLDQDQAA